MKYRYRVCTVGPSLMKPVSPSFSSIAEARVWGERHAADQWEQRRSFSTSARRLVIKAYYPDRYVPVRRLAPIPISGACETDPTSCGAAGGVCVS